MCASHHLASHQLPHLPPSLSPRAPLLVCPHKNINSTWSAFCMCACMHVHVYPYISSPALRPSWALHATRLERCGSALVKAPGVCSDDIFRLRRGGGRRGGGRRRSASGLGLGFAFARLLSLAVLLRVHLLLYVLPRVISNVRPPSWVHLRVRNACSQCVFAMSAAEHGTGRSKPEDGKEGRTCMLASEQYFGRI